MVPIHFTSLVKKIARLLCLVLLAHVGVCSGGSAGPKLEIYRPGATSPEVTSSVAIEAWGTNGNGESTVPADLSEVVAISAGGAHSVALKKDGTVVVWGNDERPSSKPPAGLTGVAAVAAGWGHTLALKEDGTVVGWGGNHWGQATVPANLTGVKAIAAGVEHSLALKADGTVVAWGQVFDGQNDVPATVPAGLANVVAIAAGPSFSLALKADGKVVGWGINYQSQISVPSGLSDVVAISAGWWHSVALKRDGTVVAWGDNSAGQVTVPAGLTNVVAISAGHYHNLALRKDGSVVAWGLNRDGQTAVPPFAQSGGCIAVAAGGDHSMALLDASSKRTATLPFGPTNLNITASQVVTLKNAGGTVMTGVTATVVGGDADQFSLPVPGIPSTLSAGDSVQVLVQFRPTSSGEKISVLRLTSDDPDMAVVTMPLTGTGTQPHLEVSLSTALISGSPISFGTVAIAAPWPIRTITIANTGTGTLDGLELTKDGTNANEFLVGALGIASLAPGKSQSFNISFGPTAIGLRTATLHILSNDAVASSFNLALSGQGSGIDARLGSGTPLLRPTQNVSLGNVTSGQVVSKTFTVRNAGTAPLTGLRWVFSGADAALFTVTPSLPITVAVGEIATFTVRFTGSAGGNRTATMNLLSDSDSERPLSVVFTGVVQAPKLSLKDASNHTIAADPGKTVIQWESHGQYFAVPGMSDAVAIAAGNAFVDVLKTDGSVSTFYLSGTVTNTGLTGVAAISAHKDYHLALKKDGTVVGWAQAFATPLTVPSGLTGVKAISQGESHALAVKQDGSVIAWGSNSDHQASVPGSATGVEAVAAGVYHSVALRTDGSVVVWGGKHHDVFTVPLGLQDVVAVAAGLEFTLALRQDGSVTAWGDPVQPQLAVPAEAKSGVVAIAAGNDYAVALKQDGTAVYWGESINSPRAMPLGLGGIQSIAAGRSVAAAICDPLPAVVPDVVLGGNAFFTISILNEGSTRLTLGSMVIEGPDADAFEFLSTPPQLVFPFSSVRPSFLFKPSHVGPSRATLKIISDDPTMPTAMVHLYGYALFATTATKPGVLGSSLTYGPLTHDNVTGLILQKLTFVNPTGVPLNGLQFEISSLPPGVSLYPNPAQYPRAYRSSPTRVDYSKPIAAGETVSLTLAYFDPKRRTNWLPAIKAVSLAQPESRLLPLTSSTLPVPVMNVRDTVNGPLLNWTTKPRAVSMVEYSDDAGKTWYRANVFFTATSTSMVWVDRGQPATYFKPVNQAARKYRIRQWPYLF